MAKPSNRPNDLALFMKRLIEDTFSITAKQAAQALPKNMVQGTVEFKIADRYAQRVLLVSTPGNAAGRVHWFVCPGCERRARKLYLPLDEAAFLCRRCHDLGYGLQQSRAYGHHRAYYRNSLNKSVTKVL